MCKRNKSLLKVVVCILMSLTILLMSGCLANKPSEDETTSMQATTTVYDEQTTQPATDVSEEAQTVESTEATEAESSTSEQTTAVEQESEKSSVPATVEEIVEFFNKSANKIKPNALKVVKNYEKRTVNEEILEVPESLESTARSMLNTFMKDDTKPTVYDTREKIVNEFLVPDQTYVSKLQAKDVVTATCVDKGSVYEIYIKLKDQVNPTAGSGIGSVCDVIEAAEVAEGAPFVEKFATRYYNCEVKVTVDKATGNVVHANYTTPLALEVRVNLFGTHDGCVGLTFEKDYTITY